MTEQAKQTIKRYDLVTNYRAGSSIEEMEPADDGEWVRYEELESALAAMREEREQRVTAERIGQIAQAAMDGLKAYTISTVEGAIRGAISEALREERACRVSATAAALVRPVIDQAIEELKFEGSPTAGGLKAAWSELEALVAHLTKEREGLRILPPEWADAANAARGLCESEANRWQIAAPSTSEHWRSVAISLGALYLAQDHVVVSKEIAALAAAHERVKAIAVEIRFSARDRTLNGTMRAALEAWAERIEFLLTSPEGPQNKDHEDHEDNSARVDTKAPSLDSRTASPTGPMRWVCKKCKKPRRRSECLSCGNQEPLSDEPCVSGVIV